MTLIEPAFTDYLPIDIGALCFCRRHSCGANLLRILVVEEREMMCREANTQEPLLPKRVAKEPRAALESATITPDPTKR